MEQAGLSRRVLARYAALGVPLGCVGLPLYVHLPKYYADTLPISLALLGTLLFLTRILDCVADPIIGYISDRYPAARKRVMLAAMPTLAAGVLALFYLPQFATATNAWAWLALLMAVTYLSYSLLTINFYASGLALAPDYQATTRVSAWREGAIIVGVLLASATPQLLMQRMSEAEAYHQFGWIYTGILVVCGAVFLRQQSSLVTPGLSRGPSFFKEGGSRHKAGMTDLGVSAKSSIIDKSDKTLVTERGAWRALFAKRELRWIFAVFTLNAIPTSITATLFLFYVSDILAAPALSGAFLLAYFLAAMVAMPVWVNISNRIGKRRALMAGMALAIASFTGAYAVAAGWVVPFVAICLFSGIALGADLTLLPSILADAIGKEPGKGGLEFGVWNFISKFTLALAAGIALPTLAWLGYEPGVAAAESGQALRVGYAVLPCVFKLMALAVLWASPIDRVRA